MSGTADFPNGSRKTQENTVIGGHIAVGHVLGSGGFGKVYYGYDQKKKTTVAIKMIDKELVRNEGIQAYVEREIDMMRRIKNPHVIRLLEAIETSKAYNLVMELAPNGELFDKIVDSQRFDEKTARNYFQQLISAVHYCHKHNIVHRDLKAENLLLGENNALKVCDFGLSRYTKEGKGKFKDNEILFTSLAGSIDYQAPEVLKEMGYEGSACDMWSCGCILFFMLCGYLPFTDRSDGMTRKRILSCQYNKKNRYLSDGASNLIAHLLERDPAKRFTTDDILQDQWFLVDLDISLFPKANLATPATPTSPRASGEFIQRAITPASSTGHMSSPKVSPTSEAASEMHQAFFTCNICGDGFLSREEVRDALIKMNGDAPVSDKDVSDFMGNFKLDKSGSVTEEEFVIGWTKHQNSLGKKYNITRMASLFHYDLEKEFLLSLRKAFDSIDKEHKGVVTAANMKALDFGLTDDDIKTLFSVIDPDHKGVANMTFEHFVSLSLQYDLLKNHPLAIRLRRLNDFFEVTEHSSFKAYLSTGYTVAGAREVIKAHLLVKQQSINTTFEEGDAPGFLYGSEFEEGKKKLEVGVRLLPAAAGYTKIIAYRIGGKTKDFHDWFLRLRVATKDEMLKAEEDTAVKGTPELM